MTYTSTESPVPVYDDPTRNRMSPFAEEEFRKFNWAPLVLQTLLFVIGLFNLYSATSGSIGAEAGYYKNQLMWFGVGLVMTAIALVVHYSLFNRVAYILYFLSVLLLVAVYFFGKKTLGATRWIGIGPFQMQPSELMKLSLILCLAKYFERDRNVGGYRLRDLILPSLLVLVPAALVKFQPDLGTAIILIAIYGTMLLFLKIHPKTLLILGLIGAVALPVVFNFGLKPYQRQRILTFLDPASDPKGAGYNSLQSMVAVGAGQVFGRGFKQGTQSQLKFLPEHHTDFAFSVFSEEHGFIGSTVMLVLFLLFFLSGLSIAYQSNDKFAMLVCVGILAMFFWHMFINMGMVTGILPVVGVPLPYVSKGGTFLITCMAGVAILTNIANKKFMF